MALLEVKDLSVSFMQYARGLKQEQLQVIHHLNVEIESGEIVAIVGSSGSGKSLLAHAILGILPQNAKVQGSIRYHDQELTPERCEALRGKDIALVPQSVTFLDPSMKVGKQVRTSRKGHDAIASQRAIFKQYKLHEHVEKAYPLQLSGGMARRVLLSTAVISGAKLIIADEPTPGLDPEVINEALASFKQLANDGCAVMLITHDISSALQIADKIAVFYAGTTVEIAPSSNFTGDGKELRHPYTKALWRALPQNEFKPIPGSQPQANDLPIGCVFAPRCEWSTGACEEEIPARMLRNGMVRCIHAT